MKRAIKAVVQRLAETKRGEQYVEDKGLISAANVLFLNSIVPIGPHNAGIQILQGNQQGQRIGNKIRSVSLTIKGTVIPLPFNASTNAFVYPTQYKMWFFYDKRFPQEVPNPGNDFFQLGGTTAPITGDLSSMWAPSTRTSTRCSQPARLSAVTAVSTAPAPQSTLLVSRTTTSA